MFSILEAFADFTSMKASQLKMKIEEMFRIQISKSNELGDLIAKRQRHQDEVNSMTQKLDELKQELCCINRNRTRQIKNKRGTTLRYVEKESAGAFKNYDYKALH